ncbi:MAG: hypothetical protein AAGJ52_04720 [Pseudomonadota bacterium]
MNIKRINATAIALTTALLLSAMVWTSAMASETPRLDRMAEFLSLSDDQTETIAGLFEAHRGRIDALRGSNSDEDPWALREEIRAERQALAEEIGMVLNEEQRARFQQFQDRQRERRRSREARIMRAIQQLDLSTDQRYAIQTLIETQRAERLAQRAAFRDELQTILTAEQLAELQSMRENRRERRNR